MSMVLYLGSYSAEGLTGVIAEGGTAREQETRALFESLGGRVLWYGFALGEADFVILAEMPDDQAAVVPPLLASATGTVRVRTVKLLTAGEMDDVAVQAREASFRAAGA